MIKKIKIENRFSESKRGTNLQQSSLKCWMPDAKLEYTISNFLHIFIRAQVKAYVTLVNFKKPLGGNTATLVNEMLIVSDQISLDD